MDIEFTNPNQFEKIQKYVGYSNYNDIWHLETWEDIKLAIVEAENNIQQKCDETKFSPEQKELFDTIKQFIDDTSLEFKKRFLELLNDYRENRKKISQKIVDYLKEKSFDMPQFNIYDNYGSKRFLEDMGFDYQIDKQNFLISFQLPKPLAQFWWKGGANSWGEISVNLDDKLIEWGHFYRELMPVIWEKQGYFEDETYLDFYRINDPGEHDPKKFYYLWEVKNRLSEKN